MTRAIILQQNLSGERRNILSELNEGSRRGDRAYTRDKNVSSFDVSNDANHAVPSIFEPDSVVKVILDFNSIENFRSLFQHSHFEYSPPLKVRKYFGTISNGGPSNYAERKRIRRRVARQQHSDRFRAASCLAVKQSNPSCVHNVKHSTFGAGPHPSVETAGLTDSPLASLSGLHCQSSGCHKNQAIAAIPAASTPTTIQINMRETL